jgi:magnesium transporter
MDYLIFRNGAVSQPDLSREPLSLPDDGFGWVDFHTSKSEDWLATVQELTGITPVEHHIIDIHNPIHPSFYDGVEDYELIIFRSLVPGEEEGSLLTWPAAFLIFDRLLVSIHAYPSYSVDVVKKRVTDRKANVARHPLDLLHMILRRKIDRFMTIRQPLLDQFVRWEQELLDVIKPFDDWARLQKQRAELKLLETVSEEQEECLLSWREHTRTEPDELAIVGFNDLLEHCRRIYNHSLHFQAQLDSLVQLHFAAVAHRTNQIMRTLTVITAIFLPLTLVAGIFGMNFQFMPELSYRYGYYIALGCMVTIGTVLLITFKRKRWF